MARKRRNDLIAGIFILVSIVLFFALLVMMGAFQSFYRNDREVKVLFDDVKGLIQGEGVFFQGRKIGRVGDVDFVTRKLEREDGQKVHVSKVLVKLDVAERYYNLLKVDSVVTVDKTLTGNLSVQIYESESDNFLSRADPETEIIGGVLFDIDRTAEKLTQALEKANSVLTEISVMLEGLRESGHLQNIFRDIADTTNRLKETSGPLVARVKEIADNLQTMIEENRENVRTAIDNVAASSKGVREFVERRLEPAADALDGALASAREAIDSLEEVVSVNQPRVDEMLASLSRSATNAETLIAEVRRRPWRLLYEPTPEEVRSLGIYDAAWAYNLSATALNHTVTELAALVRKDGGAKLDPTVVRRAMDEVEANLKRQRETEEAFYAILRSQVADSK